MHRILALFVICSCAGVLQAQADASASAAPQLRSLTFLLGTWQARTGSGTGGATATGTYTFRYDLAQHAIERTSSADTCNGPQSFDCNHHDRLLIFADTAENVQPELRALYLDSEGHTIHYRVSTPDPATAVLLSVDTPGPRFKLTYHLQAGVMIGKF